MIVSGSLYGFTNVLFILFYLFESDTKSIEKRKNTYNNNNKKKKTSQKEKQNI